jgi:hypothetical protein
LIENTVGSRLEACFAVISWIGKGYDRTLAIVGSLTML